MIPDPKCYYCAGTGLAPDGWHDCPVCCEANDDDDYDDSPRERVDCKYCGGDGMLDDITPCPHCDGEGFEWWLD